MINLLSKVPKAPAVGAGVLAFVALGCLQIQVQVSIVPFFRVLSELLQFIVLSRHGVALPN